MLSYFYGVVFYPIGLLEEDYAASPALQLALLGFRRRARVSDQWPQPWPNRYWISLSLVLLDLVCGGVVDLAVCVSPLPLLLDPLSVVFKIAVVFPFVRALFLLYPVFLRLYPVPSIKPYRPSMVEYGGALLPPVLSWRPILYCFMDRREEEQTHTHSSLIDHCAVCTYIAQIQNYIRVSALPKIFKSGFSLSPVTVITASCEMWQLLVAAVVAGSGLLARVIIFRNGDQIEGSEENPSQMSQNETLLKEEEEEIVEKSCGRENWGSREEGIFRFFSLSQNDGVMKGERRKKKKKKGRRFSVCLKRRRIMLGKIGFGKCDSCSSQQGGSLFNWGVGLMCMISAGKAEINKLNASIDETKELMNELKQKFHNAKLSSDLQDSTRENQGAQNTMSKNKHLEIITLDAEEDNRAHDNILRNLISDDGECASSVLTEESDSQFLEIDLLEAELESELQKISCFQSEETSRLRGGKSNPAEVLDQEDNVEVKTSELSDSLWAAHKQISSDCYFFQSHGVSPYELDRKLCHLLIEKQENKIVELQLKLQSTHMKLHEREAELLSLKNCVRHFRDLSLETTSDEETEGILELEGVGKRLPSGISDVVVGMKRALEFGPCDHANNEEEF
ncbi:hypothetical protein Scep_004833 [Stephania cephalantha]|uniref:Uncharacterized protein n=1 Tax=Stephania cephalantha TaxID=152367 RepID=A0AAP0PXN1_9MAGN